MIEVCGPDNIDAGIQLIPEVIGEFTRDRNPWLVACARSNPQRIYFTRCMDSTEVGGGTAEVCACAEETMQTEMARPLTEAEFVHLSLDSERSRQIDIPADQTDLMALETRFREIVFRCADLN